MALPQWISDHIANRRIDIGFAVRMDFPTEPLRVISHGGTAAIDVDGISYSPSADIIMFDKLGEVADLSEMTVNLTLAYDPARAYVQDCETGDPRGGLVEIYFVMFEDGVLASHMRLFVGYIDAVSFDPTPTNFLRISCSNEAALLSRTTHYPMTHEAQQELYPGDMGLQHVADPAVARSEANGWSGAAVVRGGGGASSLSLRDLR